MKLSVNRPLHLNIAAMKNEMLSVILLNNNNMDEIIKNRSRLISRQLFKLSNISNKVLLLTQKSRKTVLRMCSNLLL